MCGIISFLHHIELLFSVGLDDEGLYRISGLAVAIDELKDEFETSEYVRGSCGDVEFIQNCLLLP